MPTPVVELNAEVLGLFASRVQPILMNACANCHTNGHGGEFKLTRTSPEGGLANRRSTQRNLAAVLTRINWDRPQASTLLTRAVSVHGEADQPPLKSRQVPAFRTLEEWVRMAVANAPAREGAAPTVAQSTVEPKPVFNSTVSKGETTFAIAAPQPVEANPATSGTSTVPSPITVDKAAGPPGVAATKTPVDPFDPEVFNRQ
jgi:hypothetical protein